MEIVSEMIMIYSRRFFSALRAKMPQYKNVAARPTDESSDSTTVTMYITIVIRCIPYRLFLRRYCDYKYILYPVPTVRVAAVAITRTYYSNKNNSNDDNNNNGREK